MLLLVPIFPPALDYHVLIWQTFLYFLTRYYNCVPFTGCVFAGPSKMCQPRVKTFEELPLEMHPQKAPQVSSSPPTSIVEKMWTGCWHFANAIRLWKSSPQIITKNSRCTQQRSSSGVSRRHLIHMMSHCVSFPGKPDGQRDGSGLGGIWENRTSAQGCRPQKVNHTKSWWSIFLSETERWEEREAGYLVSLWNNSMQIY